MKHFKHLNILKCSLPRHFQVLNRLFSCSIIPYSLPMNELIILSRRNHHIVQTLGVRRFRRGATSAAFFVCTCVVRSIGQFARWAPNAPQSTCWVYTGRQDKNQRDVQRKFWWFFFVLLNPHRYEISTFWQFPLLLLLQKSNLKLLQSQHMVYVHCTSCTQTNLKYIFAINPFYCYLSIFP